MQNHLRYSLLNMNDQKAKFCRTKNLIAEKLNFAVSLKIRKIMYQISTCFSDVISKMV